MNQSTLTTELNFNISLNHITDYGSKVPSVNKMDKYIMYSQQKERGIQVHSLEKRQEIRNC